MSLYATFSQILQEWNSVFPQKRSFDRALRLSICCLCSFGKRTLSRAIAFAGLDQVDWAADYRLFSRCKWEKKLLFRPILRRAIELVEEDLIAVAFDDTVIKKKGKKIPGTRWLRDSLSPVFNVNIIWGMRFLQASVLLPLYNKDKIPPRAIPVQFSEVPPVQRPRRNAPQEEWNAYKVEKKTRNLSFYFVNALKELREELDELGLVNRTLLAVVDGSFCNKTCMLVNLARVELIARLRKNAQLCFKLKNPEGNRFYSKKTFTPESVRQDERIKWSFASVFHGGDWRDIRFKEVKEVYWRTGTKKKPMRLVVIAPTPYRLRKKGKLYYRDPAYLLTTDLKSDTKILIQKYFDRWQIEVNFREEKTTLGLGQAQVWSLNSVGRQPAFIVASYGALLLASVVLYQDKRVDEFIDLPKWRKKGSRRPSCLDLVTQLRRDLEKEKKTAERMGIEKGFESKIYKAAA
jgi:DDE superfamily endonuclease